MSTTFRRVVPQGAPPVYFVEDEEVDFDKVIKEEKIVLPKVVSWHAHWLAVEGVQPMVPENPPRPPVIGEWGLKHGLRMQWDGRPRSGSPEGASPEHRMSVVDESVAPRSTLDKVLLAVWSAWPVL